MENGLHRLLAPRRFRRRQEHQVDVAERRHLAPAGSAQPDDRHGLGSLRTCQCIGGEIICEPDDLVVKKSGRMGCRPATARLQCQPPGDLGAALLQRAAKDLRREAVAVGALREVRLMHRQFPGGRRSPCDCRRSRTSFAAARLPPASTGTRLRAPRAGSCCRGRWLRARPRASGAGVVSAAMANNGKSSSPAAIPPVASRPASSLASTDLARATTFGGRPASLATAMP